MKFEKFFRRKKWMNYQLDAPFLNERKRFLDKKMKSSVKAKGYVCKLANILRSIAIMASNYQKYVPVKAIWQLAHPIDHAIGKHLSLQLLEYSVSFLKYINKMDPVFDDPSMIINMIETRPHHRIFHLSAPNLKEREAFLQFKYQNGMTKKSLSELNSRLTHVQEYLRLSTLTPITMSELINTAKLYSTEKGNSYNYSFIMFLRVSKEWLSFLNLYVKEDIYSGIRDIDKVWCYLNNMSQRGLSDKTIHLNKCQLYYFVKFVIEKDNALEYLKPETIDDYFIYLSEKGFSRRTIYPLSSIIRVFLRFCEQNNWCRNGISSYVKAPRVYHNESLPYPVPWNNIQKLIEAVDTDNPTDIRNRAMFLLLAVYGLRASEVTGLCLKDIDWGNNCFILHRAKNGTPQKFPLFPIVGNAIIKYLKLVRYNKKKSRYVFLSLRAPYESLSIAAIYRFLSAELKKQNLQLKHYGSHSLRYGCATHLINTGHTFKEVADLLGHKMLETTRIYAKLDMNHLNKVSEMNWEGLL